MNAGTANKPIRAKLGEESSFYYDPEQKRWINKKPGAEQTPAAAATPPPPKSSGPPRSASGSSMGPPQRASSVGPPMGGMAMGMRNASDGSSANNTPPVPSPLAQMQNEGGALMPPLMKRTVSNGSVGSAPPSRPGTGMSNASSIDDLLGPAMMKRAGAKGTAKGKKKGRGYIDVMGGEKPAAT